MGSPASLRPLLEPGRAERLRQGQDGVVFALGAMVEPVLEAAEALQQESGLSLEVWDARFCKPLDREAIVEAAARFSWMAVVEEHALAGGFSSAVAELLADAGNGGPHPLACCLSRHGVPDRFIPHMTSREEQLQVCGLDPVSLTAAWREALIERRQTTPTQA